MLTEASQRPLRSQAGTLCLWEEYPCPAKLRGGHVASFGQWNVSVSKEVAYRKSHKGIWFEVLLARWQNRKLQSLLLPWRHQFNNNIWTISLCKKSRNQLKGSCALYEHKTNRRTNDICSLELLPLAQHNVIGRKLPIPDISLGRVKEGWNIYLTFIFFRGLSKGLVSVLSNRIEGHWEQMLWWN